MKFAELKQKTAEDLRAIAGFLEEIAKEVDEGDINAVYELVEDKWELWRQMLILRLADRQEKREAAQATPSSEAEQ
jgi:hypothetical protein